MNDLLAARFWPNVERRERGACWPWTGQLMTSGYGVFPIKPGEVDECWHRAAGAHRIAFYLIHGHWPDKALHGCDFKLCCNAENPEHVHDGSLAQNNQEMFARGRARPRGKVPLTNEQQAEICALYLTGTVRQVELAAVYRVSQVRVSQILRANGAARGKQQARNGKSR